MSQLIVSKKVTKQSPLIGDRNCSLFVYSVIYQCFMLAKSARIGVHAAFLFLRSQGSITLHIFYEHLILYANLTTYILKCSKSIAIFKVTFYTLYQRQPVAAWNSPGSTMLGNSNRRLSLVTPPQARFLSNGKSRFSATNEHCSHH